MCAAAWLIAEAEGREFARVLISNYSAGATDCFENIDILHIATHETIAPRAERPFGVCRAAFDPSSPRPAGHEVLSLSLSLSLSLCVILGARPCEGVLRGAGRYPKGELRGVSP